MEINYPDSPDKFRYFLKFLLDGHVLKWFKAYEPHLNSKSSLAIKWTQEKVLAMVNPLIKKRICTREGLLKAWAADPKFLLSGYLQWLPATLHDKVTAQWPPTL
jgi:hypothetical protein